MAAAALDEPGELIADDLKGCMLCYELCSAHGVAGAVDLEALHDRIAAGLDDVVCMDAAQYGVEHVPMPSDFIAWGFDHFASPEMSRWIGAENRPCAASSCPMAASISLGNGIPPYPEFDQTRRWWRARITTDKLLFCLHLGRRC